MRIVLLQALGGLALISLACGLSSSEPAEPFEAYAPAPEIQSASTEDLAIPSTQIPASPFPTPSPEPQATPLPSKSEERTASPPAIPENRLVVLEFPSKIKVGDSGIIRLILEMDSQGNLTPTAFVEGNELRSEPVKIPNLYDTHRVFAEARLDMAGIQYAPRGVVSEALLPGKPVMYIWSVRPTEVGTYEGTAWLHLRFVPKQGGVESRVVLTAQLLEIQSVNFLGLGGTAARLLGFAGVVLGSLLSLDRFLAWIWRLVLQLNRVRDQLDT